MLQGHHIPLRLSRSKGRRATLFFPIREAVLCVETPSGNMEPEVRRFIEMKSGWILKQYVQKQQAAGHHRQFFERVASGEILWMGEWRPLQYHVAGKRNVRLHQGVITLNILPQDQPGNPALLQPALRALAAAQLKARTMELAGFTGDKISQVRVKAVRSKWGSCSSKGAVNLNWALMMLPPELADYVMIHELMHLREMNHSPAFWAHVARYCPEYKTLRQRVQAFAWVIDLWNV